MLPILNFSPRIFQRRPIAFSDSFAGRERKPAYHDRLSFQSLPLGGFDRIDLTRFFSPAICSAQVFPASSLSVQTSA
jgi:hypothetical protein